MKLQTALPLSTPGDKITLADKILTMGSCFSANIGDKLAENKFDTLVNPFGTIFDPLSVARLLTHSLSQTSPAEETYVFSQGVYKNLELHASFTGLSVDELAMRINARLYTTREFLKSANWLIITFGTAHVYQYKKTGHYIANCQKLPAKNFSKVLLPVDELRAGVQQTLTLLQKTNPALKIIVTVSPVRHLSDGLEANSVSKAILRVLCQQLAEEHKHIMYYPAYELMMDDLRDYRFYKEDMIHPTEQAVNYIWEHFSKSYMDASTLGFLQQWAEIKRAMAHKPFNPATDEHQVFIKQTLAKLKKLPGNIDISKEVEALEAQLIKN